MTAPKDSDHQSSEAHAEGGNALAFHNFRLYVAGQGLSQIGAFFQIVAISLLVLDLNGSGLALGLVMSLQAVPMLALSPFAGVIIDRVRIHRLLRITAALASLQALVLGVVVATDNASLPILAALSFFLGCVQTFERPGSQAFLTELIPHSFIPSGVALSSATQAIGRLGGPALAALLYAAVGPEWCFFVNCAAYIGMSAALYTMRRSELLDRNFQPPEPGQFAAGLRFVWRSPIHRPVLLSNAIIGCMAFNFPLFYASLVKETFHSGSVSFGVAESLNAITAVGGGLILARLRLKPSLRMYAFACFALGLSLSWSAASPTLLIFLVGMLYFGAAVVFYQATSQSLLQQRTPPAFIGRVMSLYMLGLIGTTPVGGLLSGWLIDTFSPRAALGAGALSLLAAGLVVTLMDWRTRGAVTVPAQAEPLRN